MGMTESYLKYFAEAKAPKASAAPDWLSSKSPHMPPLPRGIKTLPQRDKTKATFYDRIADLIRKFGDVDINYTKDGLVEVDYDQMYRVLDVLDNTDTRGGMGISSIVYGHAGIGKSAIFESRAHERAGQLGREFITLSDFILECPKIADVRKNIKKYFLFVNENAGAFERAMIAGIPDPTSPEVRGFLTELTLPWVSVMTLFPDSAGFLFLDELNQADNDVMNGLFSLTNFGERTIINKYKIKGNWRIHSSGNWGAGYSINNLVPALKERLNPFYLKLTFEGWVKWARRAKTPDKKNTLIHPIIMDFIEDNVDQNFFEPPSPNGDSTKRPNPRNYELFSSTVYEVLGSDSDPNTNPDEHSLHKLYAMAGSSLGSKVGRAFAEFVRINGIIDFNEILQNPSMLLTTPDSSETTTIQAGSVFKRNLRNTIYTFDTKYTKLTDWEDKGYLVNIGLHCIRNLRVLYKLDEGLGTEMFKVAAGASMKDPMRGAFMRFLNDIQAFLEEEILDEQGNILKPSNPRLSYWVELVCNQASDIAGGNKATLKGTDIKALNIPGDVDSEDEEVGQSTSEMSPEVIKVLSTFNNQFATGKLPILYNNATL